MSTTITTHILPKNAAISMRFRNMSFLCSLFVVAIHCASGLNVENSIVHHGLYNGLFRVAVPFFFLASGYFLSGHISDDGWWWREPLKRVRTLLGPYVLWIGIFFLLVASKQMFALVMHGTDTCGIFNANYFIHAFGLHPFSYPLLTPLWYIRSLFMLILFSPVIYLVVRGCVKICKSAYPVCLIVLLAMLCFEGVEMPVTWRFFFRRFLSLEGLFYFTVGIAWRLGYVDLTIGRLRSSIMLAVGLLLLAVKVVMNVHGCMLAGCVEVLSIFLLCIAVLNIIPTTDKIMRIAETSFPVYLVHMFVLYPIVQIAPKWAFNNCLVYFAITLAVFSISILLSLFLMSHKGSRFYFARKMLFGGR